MGKLVFECYISPKRSKKNTKLYYYDFVCKRERRWLWNFLNSCMFTFYSRWTRFYMTYFFFVIDFSLAVVVPINRVRSWPQNLVDLFYVCCRSRLFHFSCCMYGKLKRYIFYKLVLHNFISSYQIYLII